MPQTQNEILQNARAVLQKIPYRTVFERDNFLFSNQSGPRFLAALCRDIEFLNLEYSNALLDWQKDTILVEMNTIANKISKLQESLGKDIAAAYEDAEPEYWVEELARRAAIEALTQHTSVETMGQMLRLPAELYETAITKCQHFLNVISKVTRLAERKANMASVPKDTAADN